MDAADAMEVDIHQEASATRKSGTGDTVVPPTRPKTRSQIKTSGKTVVEPRSETPQRESTIPE